MSSGSALKSIIFVSASINFTELDPDTAEVPTFNVKCFFLVQRVLGRGPEQREPNKVVLCPLSIIILISLFLYDYY